VSAFLYVEGSKKGADSRGMDIRCRAAFHKLLDGCGLRIRPRIVPCGSRGDAFKAFRSAMKQGKGEYVGLLVDSEDPVQNIDQTWSHLRARDQWEKPAGADDENALLMTTCMETWIVSDRAALKEHYGHALQENALPPLHDLEKRDRHDVHDKLAHATRNCSKPYAKGKRSFDVLEKVKPTALSLLPSFHRMVRILREKL